MCQFGYDGSYDPTNTQWPKKEKMGHTGTGPTETSNDSDCNVCEECIEKSHKLQAEIADLTAKCDMLEAGLRGVQGVEFDDGYSINVADLQSKIKQLIEDNRGISNKLTLVYRERDEARSDARWLLRDWDGPVWHLLDREEQKRLERVRKWDQ